MSVVRTSRKPAQKNEKQRAIAFVNWAITDTKGNALLHSKKGFSLFDNEYLTQPDKDLIEAAKANDGFVVLNAQLKVSIAKDENAPRPDISGAIVPRS